MNIYKLCLGELGTNCYVVETEPAHCVAFDIGGDSEMFLEFLENKNLKLKKILLTHGHFDHIGGVSDVVAKTGAEVYIHSADANKLESEELSLSKFASHEPFKKVSTYISISDDVIINDGDLSFTVMHTPGHTQGSVCYISDGVIFSGDTLFKQSIGRTDFADGNMNEMKSSLRRLKNLDGDFRVYSGHGDSTTLEIERKTNPYMRNI